MRGLLARLVKDERIRFLAVGATNTLVGYGLFVLFAQVLFAHIYLGYLLALIVSYCISITLAFYLYRRLVFVVTGHVIRDFIRFVSVYLVSIGVNAALLPLLVEVVGIHPLIAQALILVITTLVSFFGHKLFSFRRPAPGEPTADPGDL